MDVCASKRQVCVPGHVHPRSQRSTMGAFFTPTESVTAIKKWSNAETEDKDNSKDEDDDQDEVNASFSEADEPSRKTARGPGFARVCLPS